MQYRQSIRDAIQELYSDSFDEDGYEEDPEMLDFLNHHGQADDDDEGGDDDDLIWLEDSYLDCQS